MLDIYFIHELLYSFPLDLSLFFKKWFLYYYHGYRFYWILIVYVLGSYILDLALLWSFLKGMYSCTSSLVIITTLVLLIIIPWPHLFVTTIESFVLNFCLFWSIHDVSSDKSNSKSFHTRAEFSKTWELKTQQVKTPRLRRNNVTNKINWSSRENRKMMKNLISFKMIWDEIDAKSIHVKSPKGINTN